MESPKAKRPVIIMTSHSPRAGMNKSKLSQGNESPSPNNLPFLPSTTTGRVKLFDALASPQHKQANDKLSFASLSSSLADIRAVTDANQSPKAGKRMNTTLIHEYYSNRQEPQVEVEEKSPKKGASPKAKTPRQIKGSITGKVGSPKSPSSLHETRSLSPKMPNALALRDEIKNDYEGSPMVRVDKEAYYYDTIKHLDECGKCWTNAQKLHSSPFKVNFKDARVSNYKKDFVKHAPNPKDPLLKSTDYDAYHSHHTVSLSSTMKTDFKPWMSTFTKHEGAKARLGADGSTFFGKSNYNSEYLDFQIPGALIEREPHFKTVLDEMNFKGKSLYKDSFPTSGEPRQFVSRWFHKKEKSPYSDGTPFQPNSTYSSTYRPFKVGNGTGVDNKEDDHLSTQSFFNQYQSTYAKAFDGKSEPSCAARNFIEGNLPPSMMKNIKV